EYRPDSQDDPTAQVPPGVRQHVQGVRHGHRDFGRGDPAVGQGPDRLDEAVRGRGPDDGYEAAGENTRQNVLAGHYGNCRRAVSRRLPTPPATAWASWQ